jgi:hypothetical protein
MDYSYTQYFQDAFTPEQALDISYAEVVFERYNYSEYVDVLNDLMMTYDEYDRSIFPSLMYSAILTPINQLLELVGIELQDEVLLNDRCVILMALKVFEELDNYDIIENIIYSPIPNSVKFSFIVSECSVMDVDDVLAGIVSIKDSLISNLTSLIGKSDPSKKRTASAVIRQLKDFNRFMGKETLGISLIKHGIIVGMPFGYYMRTYSKALPIDLMAERYPDLYSLVLLSEAGSESPMLVIRDYLSTIEADSKILEQVTKLDTDFKNYVKEFERHVSK